MSNWFKKAQKEWGTEAEENKLIRYMGTLLAEVWVMPDGNEYEEVASRLANLAARIENATGIKLTPQGDYQKAI